jgi:hypothetical protein
VRDVAKIAFNINQDEDFATLECLSERELETFKADPTQGPDIDDLRLDTKGKLKSEWNLAVVDILAKKVRAHIIERKLKHRSDAYIEDLLLEKIKRLRHIWRTAQPRQLPDGSNENAQQLENRLLQKRIIVSKENRMSTRRCNVSLSYSL